MQAVEGGAAYFGTVTGETSEHEGQQAGPHDSGAIHEVSLLHHHGNDCQEEGGIVQVRTVSSSQVHTFQRRSLFCSVVFNYTQGFNSQIYKTFNLLIFLNKL